MDEKVDILPKFDRHQDPPPERIFSAAPSSDYASHVASSGRWVSDEALRLVQQLFLTEAEEKPRVVVFAGIDHGSGCSHVCASVAETLAKNSKRPVCLVDANFRTPSLAQMFGTTNTLGLSDAVVQEGPIRLFAENVAEENLWLISSGSVTANSAGLITSRRLGVRIRELGEEFEFVIIDAPPTNSLLRRYRPCKICKWVGSCA